MSPDVCVAFFVPGKAAPGGSKRALTNKTTGKMYCVDMGKGNAKWKRWVARCGRMAYMRDPLEKVPLLVWFAFVVARPKNHYGTGKNAGILKPWAVDLWPIVMPDVLKLTRSTEDALKGILYKDDAQNVRMLLEKRYARPGENVGCHIIVTTDLGVGHEALRDSRELSPDRRLAG